MALPASKSMPIGARPPCDGRTTSIFWRSRSSRKCLRPGWKISRKLTSSQARRASERLSHQASPAALPPWLRIRPRHRGSTSPWRLPALPVCSSLLCSRSWSWSGSSRFCRRCRGTCRSRICSFQLLQQLAPCPPAPDTSAQQHKRQDGHRHGDRAGDENARAGHVQDCSEDGQVVDVRVADENCDNQYRNQNKQYQTEHDHSVIITLGRTLSSATRRGVFPHVARGPSRLIRAIWPGRRAHWDVSACTPR